jgi:translation initiation factor IF-2
VETTVLSAAKLAELNALKPLPRPAAPPSNKPAATVAPPAPSRPRPTHNRQRSHQAQTPKDEGPSRPTSIQIQGNLTVQELADLMQIPATDIIRVLFMKGSMVNINQVLDVSLIESVAKELECDVEVIAAESEAKKTEMLDIGDIEYLQFRPPVVTIMGHVDHGKTTLLDAIRKTSVVSGEAGGITQRIGAYHVDVTHEGALNRVVFLDTPGHEAFTAMRARGAKVTDIAILVVAADDGVQPQTIEAISHARAANVPIVVAINKIDKPGCQPDRIKQQLSEHGLVPEEWGGDTPMVEVSALSQINLDGLLEMLLLVAELGELQANPDRAAKGTVIEANLDRARGPIATLLVQNGTLRLGDAIVAGSIFGRVKAMTDDLGQRMEEAGPSSAVQLLGLSEVPAAGDEFEVYADEREARRVADQRQEDQRQARLQQMLSRRVSLGTVSAQAQEGQLKDLNLIIKTDVQGSAEAILSSLQQLSQEEVQLRVLLAAPGEITETDVDLAAASEAIIIGFATDASGGARLLADRYGVDIREYNIIYNLLEDITGAMEGLLDPEQVEEPLGQAEVRQVITIGRGNIAGCYVLSGKLLRNTPVRILRRGSVIFEGRLDSLKRFKDDVREVASGFECGIGVDKFTDWTEGDIIDAYQLVMKRRSLATASTNRR